MDGDGNKDILTGCFEGGLYLAKGLGDGQLAKPEPMKDVDDNLIRLGQYWDYDEKKWTGVKDSLFAEHLGICGHAVDFDDDGDLDLLLGSNGGLFFWRENIGDVNSPKFATESQQLFVHDDAAADAADGEAEAKPEPLSTGSHAMPFVVDWDGDGRFDIFSGSSDGRVLWARNIGTKGKPSFEAMTELIEASRANEDGSATVGNRTQVAVGDYNHDGLLDVPGRRLQPPPP